MGNFFSGIIAGTSIDWIWTKDSDLDQVYFSIYLTAAIAAGISFLISLTVYDPIEEIELTENDQDSFSVEMFKTKKF